ncbi:MAG: OpgC family protein [Pseudomonadota bacterium]
MTSDRGRATARPATTGTRDLRLDLFRGIALLLIFINHIPGNFASYWTPVNFGFSDAAEMFVFLSGYAAALAYTPRFEREGLLIGTYRVVQRAWTLYAFHLVLFLMVAAITAYAALVARDAVYLDLINIWPVDGEPQVALVKAVTLQYSPKYLDILPLYIVLLLALPAILLLVRVHAALPLAVSLVFYVLAHGRHWNVPSYPSGGGWYLNPFAWQLLFVLGVICGYRWLKTGQVMPYSRVLFWTAIVYVAFAAVAKSSLQPFGPVEDFYIVDPDVFHLTDKSYLSAMRIAHFLALSYIAASLIPATHPVLKRWFLMPFVNCGQYGLATFCLGTVLSVVGHIIILEFDPYLSVEVPVVVGGLAILMATASILSWLDATARRQAAIAPTAPAAVPARDAP